MSDLGDDTIGPRTVLVMYAAGQTQFSKLLLQDIYNVESQSMERNAYDMITGPMALLSNQMVVVQNNATCTALDEAIQRHDVDIYLRGSDGIDIADGRGQSGLQASARQFTIATLSNGLLQIVIKVHGFKAKRNPNISSDSEEESTRNDSDQDEAVKFTGRYNATQFVRTCTTISKAAVKPKPSVKKEKEEADEKKGESFSMEDRLNSNDFHKIASIKLASREETPD
jgi:hypothetical protein